MALDASITGDASGGTTRPRVKAFMNKFWQLGFLDYTGAVMFYRGLLSVTVRDQLEPLY